MFLPIQRGISFLCLFYVSFISFFLCFLYLLSLFGFFYHVCPVWWLQERYLLLSPPSPSSYLFFPFLFIFFLLPSSPLPSLLPLLYIIFYFSTILYSLLQYSTFSHILILVSLPLFFILLFLPFFFHFFLIFVN